VRLIAMKIAYFQRERVDKELSGEPETGLTKRSGNRVLLDGTEKTLATL